MCSFVAYSSAAGQIFDIKSLCMIEGIDSEASQTSLCLLCFVLFALGEEVPYHLCSELPRPDVMACEIPCATDCVLSEWSQWSPCSHSCSSKIAEGSQSRSRSILALPAEGKW